MPESRWVRYKHEHTEVPGLLRRQLLTVPHLSRSRCLTPGLDMSVWTQVCTIGDHAADYLWKFADIRISIESFSSCHNLYAFFNCNIRLLLVVPYQTSKSIRSLFQTDFSSILLERKSEAINNFNVQGERAICIQNRRRPPEADKGPRLQTQVNPHTIRGYPSEQPPHINCSIFTLNCYTPWIWGDGWQRV